MLFFRNCVILIVFLAAVSSTVRAQESDKSVDRLKSDNNRLRTIANDTSTPPEVREVNEQLLEKNGALLKDALNRAIESLQKYEANMGDVMDPADRRHIEEKIDGYRYDLAQLEPRNGSARMSSPNSGLIAPQNSPIEIPARFVSNSVDDTPSKPAVTTIDGMPIEITSPKTGIHILKNNIEIVIKVGARISEVNLVVSSGGDSKDPVVLSVPASRVIDATVALESGINDIKVINPEDAGQFAEITITNDAKAPKQSTADNFSRYVQAYFGTEVAGASAAASDAQPYFNLRTNIPIKNRDRCPNPDNNFDMEKNLGCFAFWADFRFASTPSQTLPNFTSLTANGASTFFGSNQSSSINQLVKSFQTKIGLELGMGANFSFIGGVGITSPLSSRESVQVFKIPKLADGTVLPAFQDVFGHIDYSGLDNLVLTTGERDRFFRNWFVGGRVRYTFYDSRDVNPAELDLTIGQDESITKKLNGRVLKFDATLPIKLGDREVLYFGAGFNLKMTRKVNVVTVPFFLEPIANFNLFGNNNLVRNLDDTPFATSNRDSYSFRIGVDIIRLIFGNKDKPANAAAGK